MALNDLLNGKLRVLGLGLILVAGCEGADNGITPAGGCKYDSECKGNRVCIGGECVEGSGNLLGKDTYSNIPDTYNLDVSQNCTSHFKKVCSDGDLYWKDSCGNLENKLDNCAYGCSNGKCNEPGKDTVSWEDSSIPDVSSGCSDGEYTCKNGECIPKSYVCDGSADCNGEEDENGCYTPDTYVGKDTPACEGNFLCEVEGGKKCSNNLAIICADYQGNGCLEYIMVQDCEEIGMTCVDGACKTTTCTDECDYIGQKECLDSTSWRMCLFMPLESECLTWSVPNTCSGGMYCEDGVCK